jgi:hypothetical protein
MAFICAASAALIARMRHAKKDPAERLPQDGAQGSMEISICRRRIDHGRGEDESQGAGEEG